MGRMGEMDGDEPEGRTEFSKDSTSRPFADPLASPWDEESSEGRSRIEEPEMDPVFEFERAPEATSAGEESTLGWDVPAGEVVRRERRMGAWYPPSYARPSAERQRLENLQRGVRTGAIALPRPERRWAVTVREVVETLLLALLIFLAVRASFQNFRVEGTSMVPSLEDGEYLIVNKLSYARVNMDLFDWVPFVDAGENPVQHLWDSPSRGDVVVFKAPTNTERDFIKRIIGVPGDTIEIDRATSEVIVNGEVIGEPYIRGSTTCSHGCGPWEVPEENSAEALTTCGSDRCYFVMGDNRQNSSDSRQGWFVPEENIVGKALITYWNDGSPNLKLAPNRSVSPVREASAEE
jgi:signal peptidase I